MAKRPISSILSNLKATVAELEAALSSENGTPMPHVKSATPTTESYSGPTGGIKMLLDQAFFKTPQSLGAVLAELRKEGYNYRKEVISTALIRLVRQRTLTRVPSQDSASREKWNYAERK